VLFGDSAVSFEENSPCVECKENAVVKRFSEGTRKISFVSQSRSKECSLKGHTNSVTKNRERHDISRVAVSVMSLAVGIYECALPLFHPYTAPEHCIK